MISWSIITDPAANTSIITIQGLLFIEALNGLFAKREQLRAAKRKNLNGMGLLLYELISL
jgi:hypothetical protein